MWALTLLAVLQAARANPCIRITYGTDESGAKTVSKSFAITARAPEACKKNGKPGFVRRRYGREEYRASRRQTDVDRGVEIKSEYRAE
jgi:hypothetical protein